MTELQLMAQCNIWLWNGRPELRGRFRRVKNETDHFGMSARSRMAQGVENRSTGIVKGTWDSFLVTNPIVWIEFKVGAGRLTDEQREFAKMGDAVGWQFAVIRNLEDFKILINGKF